MKVRVNAAEKVYIEKVIVFFAKGNQNHHLLLYLRNTNTVAIKPVYYAGTLHSYPRVPRPDMGGLGGFCVGGFVLDKVPVLAGWLFPC